MATGAILVVWNAAGSLSLEAPALGAGRARGVPGLVREGGEFPNASETSAGDAVVDVRETAGPRVTEPSGATRSTRRIDRAAGRAMGQDRFKRSI